MFMEGSWLFVFYDVYGFGSEGGGSIQFFFFECFVKQFGDFFQFFVIFDVYFSRVGIELLMVVVGFCNCLVYDSVGGVFSVFYDIYGF